MAVQRKLSKKTEARKQAYLQKFDDLEPSQKRQQLCQAMHILFGLRRCSPPRCKPGMTRQIGQRRI
jgi:hypothetical protein